MTFSASACLVKISMNKKQMDGKSRKGKFAICLNRADDKRNSLKLFFCFSLDETFSMCYVMHEILSKKLFLSLYINFQLKTHLKNYEIYGFVPT